MKKQFIIFNLYSFFFISVVLWVDLVPELLHKRFAVRQACIHIDIVADMRQGFAC